MHTAKIVGLGGSLRERSRSLGALKRALCCAREVGAQTELLDVRELALPIFQPGRVIATSATRQLAIAIESCDALLVCSPVYQDSVSGMVKNALDHLHDLNPGRWPLKDKHAGVIAVAQGENTANTLSALHAVCAAMGADVSRIRVGLPERVFDENGTVYDPVTEERLESLVLDLVFSAVRRSADAVNGAAR
jgi:FMN reductase